MSKLIMLQNTTLITWAKRNRILNVTHILLFTSKSSVRGLDIILISTLVILSIQLKGISSIFFLRFDCFFWSHQHHNCNFMDKTSHHWEIWVHLSAHAIFPQKLAKVVVVLFIWIILKCELYIKAALLSMRWRWKITIFLVKKNKERKEKLES